MPREISTEYPENERLSDLIDSPGWKDFLARTKESVVQHRTSLLTSHTLPEHTRTMYVGMLQAIYNTIRQTYTLANRIEDFPADFDVFFRGEERE